MPTPQKQHLTPILVRNAITHRPWYATRRQREVIKLMCDGLNTKEIAGRLGISTKTVEYHFSVVFQKTKCRTKVELAMLAVKSGMVRYRCPNCRKETGDTVKIREIVDRLRAMV